MIRALALIALASPSYAETPCFTHSELVALMDNSFDASQMALGREEGGALVEVFVAPDGQWALAITTPDMKSCVAATGRDWMMINPVEVN